MSITNIVKHHVCAIGRSEGRHISASYYDWERKDIRIMYICSVVMLCETVGINPYYIKNYFLC